MKNYWMKGLFCVVSVFLLISCASMKYENYAFTDKKPVFDGNLEQGKDVFYETTNGTITYEDEVLFMKDNDFPNNNPEDYEGDPWVRIKKMSGRNSVINFELKLSNDQPEFQLNLMVMPDTHQRMNFIFRDKNLHFFIATKDDPSYYQNFPDNSGIASGKWHQVDVVLGNEKALLFIDGRRKKTYPIPDQLLDGYIGLECHGEAFIRNFKVTNISAYEVVKD